MLICLRETWSHMSAVSGFDPLFPAIEAYYGGQIRYFFVPPFENINQHAQYLIQRVWGKLLSSPPLDPHAVACSFFVQLNHEVIAAKIVRYAQRHPEALVMLSAGENQFGATFTGAPQEIRSRIVLVAHQPPSWFRLHWRDFSMLEGLAAIVCLSNEQRDFISTVCSSPTILSRHGVCHEFFRPLEGADKNRGQRLLFVGQWLRDFDTLVAAMELIWQKLPEVQLDCVIIRTARNHPTLLRLARDPRVTWHSGIDQHRLLDLYQQASLLFLPLIDSVANNAIGEALSSGLPIVSSRVGGTQDYVPEGAGELCPPGNAAAHAEAVVRWLADPAKRKEAGSIGRRYAETALDWGTIAKELAVALDRLS